VVVDCHCHAGIGDGLTGPWDTSARLDRYLARADRAGIERTVIFPPFHTDYARANRMLAAIVRSRPRRFIGFAFVHPTRDAGRIGPLIHEAVTRLGLRGIKIHRYDARITREVCDAARAYSLPVIYDVMGEVSTVELLAEEYPTVNWIIPHMGSFSDDWRAQVALTDQLVRWPNVYTDTSGVRRFDILENAARRSGEKILFGSDGPWLHPGLELAKVRALPLSPAVRQLVEGGTILRLIAGVRRPRARLRMVPPRPSDWTPTGDDPWAPTVPALR